jgi:hypothetical protein
MTTLHTPAGLPTLTCADRRDRCSARALIRALLSAGELLLCGRHARAHEERLIEIGADLTLVDDR